VPSRKRSRDASSGSADQYRAEVAAVEYEQPSPGAVGLVGSGAPGSGTVLSQADDAAGGPGAGQPGGPEESSGRRRRLLKNWRVRSRLVLLIAIPTATAVALGGTSIVSSWRSAVAFQRTETLASLSTKITQLAYEIEAERDAIVWYIAEGINGRLGLTFGQPSTPERLAAKGQLQIVQQQFVYTDPWKKSVDAAVAQIGSGYPAAVQASAVAVISRLRSLDGLRTSALKTRVAAIDVINAYDQIVGTLLAFDDQVALSSSDPQLTSTAHACASISRLEDEDSTQRAIVMYGLVFGKLTAGLKQSLNASIADQAADLSSFTNFATPSQISSYTTALAQSLQDRVDSARSQVIATNPNALKSLPIVPTDWYGEMSDAILRVHGFEEQLATSAVDRAQALRKRAIISAIAVGSLILLVLVLSLLFTVFVGRSMVRPLRRLRAGALEVAGIRLPETVRRMSETDGENVPVDVDPIDVDSSDEIGEVARAFDQVHREALRLAATEAALRGNVNAMFVNLSRRSQSLVERQIRLIDELEQGEQDSERLGSLFQMDHLATRMRRNSENLLVLAGHESSRRWNQPVPLVDVLRAAISEIEQYERVMLNVQPGIAVRGPAVNDVVHLIAELAENATSFSSADTPVSVSGHLLGSGGVLLDITDEGVGMGGDEMAHANWRLDNPPVVDVAVSRRMGLFVVARLAARHGIRVRLRPASGNGLTALVWLPDEVIVHESTTGQGEPGRLPDRPARVAIEPSGTGPDSPGWSEPGGPPSAYDEVAAARARFSPLPSDGNGDLSHSGGYSQPGFTSQPGFGQVSDLPYGDRPTGDRLLSGPGFGDRWSGERDFASAEFSGPGIDQRSVTDYGGVDLGPQRVPGAGPHPGQYSTGPIPALDTGPRASVEHPEWFAAGRRPAGDAADSHVDAGLGAGTGPMPAVGDVPQQWSPAASGTWAGDQSQPSAAGWQAPTRGSEQSTQERQVWRDGQTDQYAQPVYGAPVARSVPLSGTFRTESQFGAAAGGVIVPPPASLGEENRLPIFEAVESDWFRRGRPSVEWPSTQGDRVARHGWSSPSDEGWRAAEVAVAPASGGTTVAGLPRRVPQANLIPGAANEAPAPVAVPTRSASATRERFASLQRGIREGRAATGIDRSEGTGEVPGDG
jgi:signal transduction histidine kinase